MTRGSLTLPEISAQPEALAAAWKQLQQQTDWVDRHIGNTKYDEVVFIGSGSSYYQAQAMAATFKGWLGRSAAAVPSSDIFLIRDQTVARRRNVLLVGVSRSGESSEVILALESVKDVPGWATCGITCYADSRLGKMTECLLSPLGQEKSTVMTKSFSSMTYMMQAAIALAAGPQQTAQIRKLLDLHPGIVERARQTAEQLVNGNALHKFVYLGLGVYFGLAQEACLKLKEMSYEWTESYGTLEFRHGPKSIVEPGTAVVLLLSERARAYELKVAEEMKAYGAFIVIVTARAEKDTAFADAVFEVGGAELSDEARAVGYLPLVQYFGYYVAMKKGVDPDYPRNLTQVVKL